MAIKILIVDDSKLARMSVAKLLSGLRPDWTRLEAANAEEALALAGQRAALTLFCWISTCLAKPAWTWPHSSSASHPHIPVAIVSANIQLEIVERANQAGASLPSESR